MTDCMSLSRRRFLTTTGGLLGLAIGAGPPSSVLARAGSASAVRRVACAPPHRRGGYAVLRCLNY